MQPYAGAQYRKLFIVALLSRYFFWGIDKDRFKSFFFMNYNYLGKVLRSWNLILLSPFFFLNSWNEPAWRELGRSQVIMV